MTRLRGVGSRAIRGQKMISGGLRLFLRFRLHAEPICCRAPYRFARRQDPRRKGRMIDRVGKMLGLEAEAGVLLVDHTPDALAGAIEMVAAVKLHPRLGGPDFHHPPMLGFRDPRAEGQRFAAAVENEVVIVTLGEARVVADMLADPGGPREVEARALDGRQ